MSQYITPILFALAIFVGLTILDIFRRAEYRRNIKKKIEESFGKNPEPDNKEHKYERFFNIFGGDIDDVTFKGLKLKRFMEVYNHRMTTLGDEIYYYSLRNLRSKEEVKKIQTDRQKMLSDLALLKSHQEILLNLGRRELPILDILREGIEVDYTLRYPVYLLTFTPIYIILLIVFLKFKSVMFILVLIISNGWVYYQMNKDARAYSESFLYMGRIFDCAEKLIDLKTDYLIEEKSQLEEKLKQVRPFKKAVAGFMGFTFSSPEMDFVKVYINALTMSEARRLFRAQKHLEKYGDLIFEIYRLIGEIDVHISNASIYYGFNVCDVKFEEKILKGEQLKHPLIENAVGNSFELSNNSIILTGSNASGKSTFLRTVGINHILAGSFGFVFGSSYTTDEYPIISALDLNDSIEDGISYFMAETLAIKEMLEKEDYLLLLDEIFRGTNTIDRICAAYYTLKYLGEKNHVIAATHDIELTKLLKRYLNYHFEEKIEDGDIYFDYRLKDGPATSRNAIEILNLNDYPKEIVDNARDFAKILEKRDLLKDLNP